MAQNKQSAIAPVQLAAVMGAALLADVFLQPFGRRAPLLTAQHGILCAAVKWRFFHLFCGCCAKKPAGRWKIGFSAV